MTLINWLQSLGYMLDWYPEAIRNCDYYSAWYAGIVDMFHKYYVYNGDKRIQRTRYTLNLPKKIAENFADLILNSKTSISLSNDKKTEHLKKILDENDFYTKANQLIEKSFALGTGAILVHSFNGSIKIQYIQANNIIPLKFDQNTIESCAFVADSYDPYRHKSTKYVQLHELQDDGYLIRGYIMDVGSGGEISVYDELGEQKTFSFQPRFAIIKPNIVNNIDMPSPMGLPIYFNSLDIIKSLDIIYDSLVNEIQNGRKRLFVTADAMRVDSFGHLGPSFDPNDVVFYRLDGNFNDDKKYVQEVNGTLRVNELRTALRTGLEVLSLNLGLGQNYFRIEDYQRFENRTATEVVASSSDLHRTIHKHEILVRSALINVIKAIQDVCKSEMNIDLSDEIFIDFDDSVIESDSERREQDRKDLSIGAMSLVEYRSKWYGESIDTAKEMINLIDNERRNTNV